MNYIIYVVFDIFVTHEFHKPYNLLTKKIKRFFYYMK